MASKEKTPPDDTEIEEGEVLDLGLDTDMSLEEEGAAARTLPVLQEQPRVNFASVDVREGVLSSRELPNATPRTDNVVRERPAPQPQPWIRGGLWRCEAYPCRTEAPHERFSGLEKHWQRLHHPQKILYVCQLGGFECFRNQRHDSVRDHCRKAAVHQGTPMQERVTASEHLPWVRVANDRYVPAGPVPPMPRNPQTGEELKTEPRPLPFAGSQIHVDARPHEVQPRASGSTADSHTGRQQYTVHQAHATPPVETVRPPNPVEPEGQPDFEAEREALRQGLAEVRRRMEVSRAREVILLNRMDEVWEEERQRLIGALRREDH